MDRGMVDGAGAEQRGYTASIDAGVVNKPPPLEENMYRNSTK